jgi:uncharacterized damage-inducible protein DinB
MVDHHNIWRNFFAETATLPCVRSPCEGNDHMNANAFRHLYDYHFTENRQLWDSYITALSHEQFTQPVNYSHGAVRDQIVHLMSVDHTWFSGLRGVDIPEPLDPAAFPERESIRAQWDSIEQTMRDYLAGLRDEMLFEKPLADGEDKDLSLWQVLIHVVNHGTDHRAQLLRLFNELGIKTTSQDYIFYAYEHLFTDQ